MALWKVTSKGKFNWGSQVLEKGMFVEMTTSTGTLNFGNSAMRQQIIDAFNIKYSTRLDVSKASSSYLTIEKIG